MSVTFSISGVETDVEDYGAYVNTSNANCGDLLVRLGIPVGELVGEMRAKELGERCRAALASPAAQDKGLPAQREGNYFFMGRPAGRINMRITELLALSERAGELGLIRWG